MVTARVTTIAITTATITITLGAIAAIATSIAAIESTTPLAGHRLPGAVISSLARLHSNAAVDADALSV